jgi:hypothetical protein
MKKNAIKKMFLYLRYQKLKKRSQMIQNYHELPFQIPFTIFVIAQTLAAIVVQWNFFFIEKKQLIQIYSFNY